MLPRIPSLNIQGSIKRKLESIGGGGGEKSSIRSACKRWPVLLGRGSIVEGSVSFFFRGRRILIVVGRLCRRKRLISFVQRGMANWLRYASGCASIGNSGCANRGTYELELDVCRGWKLFEATSAVNDPVDTSRSA